MKFILILIISLTWRFSFAQDNVPSKNELTIKAKGKKFDLFIVDSNYYLLTKNIVEQYSLYKIDAETAETVSKKNIEIKYKIDSSIAIDDNGELIYLKNKSLNFSRNVKFRIEYEDKTYLENHKLSHLKPCSNVAELPEFFDGELNYYLGINTVFEDSIYFSSKMILPIDKYDVIDFVYYDSSHIIIINKLDETVGSSGDKVYYIIDSKIYYSNKNGELIWKIEEHKELKENKYRAELELSSKALFENIVYKGKLILFYQLYITIYDLKTGEYKFIDTKKGSHWKCYYKRIENKIYEYSNKEIREIDLDKLIE